LIKGISAKQREGGERKEKEGNRAQKELKKEGWPCGFKMSAPVHNDIVAGAPP